VTLPAVIAALGDLVVSTTAAASAHAPTSPAWPTTAARDGRAVFVALKGLKADRLDFVPEALRRGAALVVSESQRREGLDVAWVVVRDGRLALALIGAEVHGHPSREIPVIGVTGTNGKTTTTYLLAAVLDAAGQSAGVMGTVHYKIGQEARAKRRAPRPKPPTSRRCCAR
jgi:UDP-N-acetylmuramoyl-L-alanyl-D-glutamate--2,6-diaminopimelate ligase